MDISKIKPGNEDMINVFIECTKDSEDFYEYDVKTDTFVLKKALSLPFPGCYGFIPQTHHIDGEPLDVLVLTSGALQQGVVLPSRPLGIIRLKGEIPDDILIAVSISDKNFENLRDISSINNLNEIKIFLEGFKGAEIEQIFNVEHSKKSIKRAIELYKKEFG